VIGQPRRWNNPGTAADPPETVDAMPFTDDGLPEAIEEEEGGGGIRNLEEDVCKLRSQCLLDEWLIGHPVTLLQGTISVSLRVGGRRSVGRRTVKDSLP